MAVKSKVRVDSKAVLMKINDYLPFMCDILLLKKFANKIIVLLVLIKVNKSFFTESVIDKILILIDKMLS